MNNKRLAKIEELKNQIPLKDDVFMLFARHKNFPICVRFKTLFDGEGYEV